MEKDCIIATGCSSFLKERLFDMSDPYEVNICSMCGNIFSVTDECHNCVEDGETDKEMVQTNLPYSSKLLFQELMSMGIKIQLRTD